MTFDEWWYNVPQNYGTYNFYKVAQMAWNAAIESKIGGTAHNNERKEISALITEIYSVAPATREYSREEVITFLQRAKTSSVS